jgi:hypothetical protein
MCCGKGNQECIGAVEFATWGPCTDTKGVSYDCTSVCGPGEFGPGCDGGTGTPDAGTPPVPDAGRERHRDAGTPKSGLCTDENVNNEPEILVGYEPASGQSVAQSGQIKVWVNDEHPEIIAPNEQVDPNTGVITAPGDRTAKAADGYLWEPALYIAPQTADNGGTPYFPQIIKGWYNNNPSTGSTRNSTTTGVQVPGMDAPPAGANLSERYTTEVIWDVSALGLAPGTYTGQFLIHDGDRDRGVGCVTIVISP